MSLYKLTEDEKAAVIAWVQREVEAVNPIYKYLKGKQHTMPEAAKQPESTVLLELDLGDDELVVRQFSDGMYTLQHSEPRLLLNEEQMREVIRKLAIDIGGAKGWVLNEDFGL